MSAISQFVPIDSIAHREQLGVDLPPEGKYATGILFLDKITAEQVEERFTLIAHETGLKILCWRTVPKNSSVIGEVARTQEPLMRQPFIVPEDPTCDVDDFKRMVSSFEVYSDAFKNCPIYVSCLCCAKCQPIY